ncbi:hypothetical protein E4Q08_11015 [Candidatus Accumulibacter phosphatis]|uniref:Uncharacterized protein n=1 Tax=Candidatus Accumulibacter contiguus TaxID=2954381 RepID=A0ABX1T9G2_9PROT|nr:hypothetical protein [Candidatus Accumulibacter contiguus]
MAVLRLAIHCSLPPERVLKAGTPADIGWQYHDAGIGKPFVGDRWLDPLQAEMRIATEHQG